MTARFATLAEWLQWQESLHPNVIDLGLERVRNVAARLFGQDVNDGKPLTITVAGTNGKGSCVRTVSVLLAAAGKRVGAFSSPHLLRYNERICINNVEVSDGELCAAFAAIDDARGDTSLTYFEFNALAALWLFRQHAVDVQVLEVGLGGRLDAVNVVNADLAIITNIALDHVEWLGDTREKIAVEKAGILRPHGRLVYGEVDMPASLYEHVTALGVDLRQCGKDFSVSIEQGHCHWCGTGVAGTVAFVAPVTSLPVPSVACALQALVWLDLFDAVSAHQLWPALQLPGRFEIHRDVAGVHYLFDVAHNPAGARFLAERLAEQQWRADVCLFGVMVDKDIPAIIAPLLDCVRYWVPVVLAGNQRAATPAQLREQLQDLGVDENNIGAALSTDELMKMAQSWQGALVLVTGSFYTVEAVRRVVLEDS